MYKFIYNEYIYIHIYAPTTSYAPHQQRFIRNHFPKTEFKFRTLTQEHYGYTRNECNFIFIILITET